MLKEKIVEQDESLKIVEWYVAVFEGGNDTRDIAEKLFKITKQHENLSASYKKLKADLEKKSK